MREDIKRIIELLKEERKKALDGLYQYKGIELGKAIGRLYLAEDVICTLESVLNEKTVQIGFKAGDREENK